MTTIGLEKIRGFAGLVLVAGVLAACGGATQPGSVANTVLLGASNPPPPIDLERFGAKVKCPPLSIRPGTESFSVYEGDESSAYAVRYQANISDTASECRLDDDVMTIRIGVRGRLLAGPKRRPGPLSVPLPLRIAVTSGPDSVVYSELHLISTELTETETSKAWLRVIEDIRLPASGALRVFVGFDDADRPGQ